MKRMIEVEISDKEWADLEKAAEKAGISAEKFATLSVQKILTKGVDTPNGKVA